MYYVLINVITLISVVKKGRDVSFSYVIKSPGSLMLIDRCFI